MAAGRGPVQLRLLDGFRLTSAGRTIGVPPSAQRVLVFIALQDRPVSRSLVAGTLWGDTGEARAQASLRSALWRLGGCGPPVVGASGRHLSLDASVRVDLRQAEAIARAAVRDRSPLTLGRGWDLFRVDLLPDWYDEWVLLERESYRQLRLRALETMCEGCLVAGRTDEALEAGLAAVAADPLRESAHRAVIRVHIAEGNAHEAIRQYELFHGFLDKHAGLQPSPRMRRLITGLPGYRAPMMPGVR